MRFPKACKLHLIPAREQGRFSMNNVLHIPGKLVATDGRKLVVLNVEEDEQDEDKVRALNGDPILIPAAMVKEATKGAAKNPAHLVVSDGRACVPSTTGTMLQAPLASGEFPKWEAVVPEVHDTDKILVGLNAKYLHEIARALGAADCNIFLEVDTRDLDKGHATKPYQVRNGNGFAVLMPVSKTVKL